MGFIVLGLFAHFSSFIFKHAQGKEAVVPLTVKMEPLKDEPFTAHETAQEDQDAVSVFKVSMKAAEIKGLDIKSKDLSACKRLLGGNKIAIGKGLSLEMVNYEIADQRFHTTLNCDRGNLIESPLAKHYNAQAERAAALIMT